MHNCNMYVIGCCGLLLIQNQAECRPWYGHLFNMLLSFLCLVLAAVSTYFVIVSVVVIDAVLADTTGLGQLGGLHGLFLRGADFIAQTKCHTLWKNDIISNPFRGLGINATHLTLGPYTYVPGDL